jgi:hypothetical protein
VPRGLTVNDYNNDAILDLIKYMPMKDLLKCSAELYDLYIKDNTAAGMDFPTHRSRQRSPPPPAILNKHNKDSFVKCFP